MKHQPDKTGSGFTHFIFLLIHLIMHGIDLRVQGELNAQTKNRHFTFNQTCSNAALMDEQLVRKNKNLEQSHGFQGQTQKPLKAILQSLPNNRTE